MAVLQLRPAAAPAPASTPSSATRGTAHDDEVRATLAPEAGRYHLYLSLACPFSHRPYLVSSLLGLEHAVSLSTVAARRHDEGWEFDAATPDPLHEGTTRLSTLYRRGLPGHTGPGSVPVLWDRQDDTLASNDSADIAWQLATTFLPLARTPIDLVPANLAGDIQDTTAWLHTHVNRKVYHVGFAARQEDYTSAVVEWFAALDELEARLARQAPKGPHLHGERLTLSDLFLLPTLVRMEAIYHGHFKANLRALPDYPHLYAYLVRLVKHPAIRRTLDLPHTRLHYYYSHAHINPTRIVPAGPTLAWL